MTVTRDVIYDLLPAYFAGQTSDDTRALVAEFFKADPEFARMAERFRSLSAGHVEKPDAEDQRERLVLERTRRFLRYRNQLIGFAVAYSLMPLLFVFRDGHVAWFMLRDKPLAALLFGLAGVGCWIGVYAMGRRSRPTGL
jgi:hypothetical protein